MAEWLGCGRWSTTLTKQSTGNGTEPPTGGTEDMTLGVDVLAPNATPESSHGNRQTISSQETFTKQLACNFKMLMIWKTKQGQAQGTDEKRLKRHEPLC